MAKSRRTYREPGTVDFNKLGHQLVDTPTRFRILYNVKTKTWVRAYCYATGRSGPWIGYDTMNLDKAPCTHCGRLQFASWAHASKENLPNRFHLCPGTLGKDSMGNEVPCPYSGLRSDAGEHVCDGVPSMSYHGVERWTAQNGWEERDG